MDMMSGAGSGPCGGQRGGGVEKHWWINSRTAPFRSKKHTKNEVTGNLNRRGSNRFRDGGSGSSRTSRKNFTARMTPAWIAV